MDFFLLSAFLENIYKGKLEFFVRIITLLCDCVNNCDTHSWRWECSSLKLFSFAYSMDCLLLYLLGVLCQGASNK